MLLFSGLLICFVPDILGLLYFRGLLILEFSLCDFALLRRRFVMCWLLVFGFSGWGLVDFATSLLFVLLSCGTRFLGCVVALCFMSFWGGIRWNFGCFGLCWSFVDLFLTWGVGVCTFGFVLTWGCFLVFGMG